MTKQDLLLEIGLEEMPARFVTNSMNQLAEKVQNWLENKKIGYGEVRAFSTPRRLAVLVYDVNDHQEDIHEEAKGPAKRIALDENGNWTKAAIGFSRGQGMTVEDIFFKEINGVEYAYVKKFLRGAETLSLLPQLEHIITSLSFPKNMHWGNEELKYIRPIKWIVAMFGHEIIPFSVAHVAAGNSTYGHRFLGNKFEIGDPKDYEKALLEQFVIADPHKRKEAIVSQIERIGKENNWMIPIDKDLLEEVNNLVEYPTALYGQFEEEFLELPEEVLITSMKEHQRYFPVKSIDGKLLPYFVTVRNGNRKHLDTVARGNAKVLRARLADAAFFYKEDQKMEIDQALKKLETIVFHEEIGTLAEKVGRVRRLTKEIMDDLELSEKEKIAADRAAEICKFDLVTHMVYEFPELQGFMGEKYALLKGEDSLTARAINEHYMPRNAEDSVPETNPGTVLSIADKLDTVVSFFAIGLIPSGSQDPYALRRQATGIVQMLIHKDWNLPLEELVDKSIQLVEDASIQIKNREELEEEIMTFFKLRLKYYLEENGIRHDIIDALLSEKVGTVSSLVRKAEVLQLNKEKGGFKENIEALSRVLNISSKATDAGEITPSLFENESEHKLYNHFLELSKKVKGNISEEEYFELLTGMKNDINDYFDHTMVMANNEQIRENRLNLMYQLAKLIKGFARVNNIIVK